ncbi:hypothetical protein RRG08_065948 [Elysia crispata]|uniref:Uncharacterized protein n=1 Tax=Elysia crispata TaxID=231223 RepID=A0AAE0ZFU4_9GAST|nr:hypothetical protein RRG08_065948 [Elysia crispata]
MPVLQVPKSALCYGKSCKLGRGGSHWSVVWKRFQGESGPPPASCAGDELGREGEGGCRERLWCSLRELLPESTGHELVSELGEDR